MTASLFEQAVAYHSAGQVDQAMTLYQQVVETDPAHAGAIHLLGVALSQKGQFDLAVQFIQNAIVLNAGVPEFHLNLGNALMGLGQAERAVAAYGRAVALNAQLPEAWFGLANGRAQLNRADEAVSAYQQAIALRPDFAEALLNMGVQLLALRRLDEAVAALAQAGNLRPHDPQPRWSMGQALEMAGYSDEAATLYASLVELGACPVSLLFQAGNRLAALRHHDQAVKSYQTALHQVPGEVVLWTNMANSLRDLGRLDEAKAAYAQALNLAPNDSGILSNLGTVVKDLGDLPKALPLLYRAVELGGDVAAHSNLGHALYLQGNLDGAAQAFRDGLRLAPEDPDATFHLAVVELKTGRWAEGWRHYEARWHLSRFHELPRNQSWPRWDGQDLHGKTILLWSEQGLGDTLHFIRYAQQVKAKGGTVVVECQKPLVPLVANMACVDRVVAVGEAVSGIDVQAPLLSLPLLLGVTLENLQATSPYLAVPSHSRVKWRNWNGGDRPKVGLVWSGESRRHDVECVLIDHRRSLNLDQLAPLLAVDGVQFVSLQMGPPRRQLAACPQILDPSDDFADFADTAAAIEHLDLVISVDTSVPHLAAAMGKPVWLLSRFDGCWRWLNGRRDSPWYPTMTLYSQKQSGDWQGPVQDITQDLVRWRETR